MGSQKGKNIESVHIPNAQLTQRSKYEIHRIERDYGSINNKEWKFSAQVQPVGQAKLEIHTANGQIEKNKLDSKGQTFLFEEMNSSFCWFLHVIEEEKTAWKKSNQYIFQIVFGIAMQH